MPAPRQPRYTPGVMRSRFVLPLVCAVVLTGCPDDGGSDDGPQDTGAASSDGSAGDMTTAPGSTGDPDPATGTTASIDPDTTAADSDSESTAAAESESGSSTGTTCEPGSQGCACDAGMCDDVLQCVDDMCIAAGACMDHPEGEPNDSEAQAIDLGEVAGCTLGEVLGAIDEDDTDWFSYHGTVDPDCNMDTSAIVDADPALEVCMYWECDQGNEQIVCFGTPEGVSPEGRPGCCGDANNVVFMLRQCLGVGDQPDGTVYLEVREPEPAQCVDYGLAYLF